MHDEPGLQQSPLVVHALPSVTQASAHENPVDPPRHSAEQHSEGMAQVDGSERHAPSPGAGAWHRLDPDGGGNFTHASPAQQSGLPPHISPSAPHVGAGWQIPIAPSGPAHTPEQQSAFDEHSSHWLRQPPAGAQRLTPSASITHSREQQSGSPPQMSPTCAVQPLWSFSLHMGSGEQCPTDCASTTQSAVQQSALEPHTSP